MITIMRNQSFIQWTTKVLYLFDDTILVRNIKMKWSNEPTLIRAKKSDTASHFIYSDAIASSEYDFRNDFPRRPNE